MIVKHIKFDPKSIPKVAQVPTHAPHKPYKPTSHPQQARLDSVRAAPSLVTTSSTYPHGKGR